MMEEQMMILNLILALILLIILFITFGSIVYLVFKNKLENNKIEMKKIETSLTIERLKAKAAEDEKLASQAQLDFQKSMNEEGRKEYKSLGAAAKETLEEMSKGD